MRAVGLMRWRRMRAGCSTATFDRRWSESEIRAPRAKCGPEFPVSDFYFPVSSFRFSMATILIVEDKPKMLRLLELSLAEENFTTRSASDAEAGLKILAQ